MLKISVTKNLKPLEDLARRARQLDGQHNVPIAELLTPQFLSSCCRFQSIEEMFEASGFKINSAEDFKSIPDREWDTFIAANTSFADWQTLLSGAVKAWTARRLGL
jgi:hypothetical protein